MCRYVQCLGFFASSRMPMVTLFGSPALCSDCVVLAIQERCQRVCVHVRVPVDEQQCAHATPWGGKRVLHDHSIPRQGCCTSGCGEFVCLYVVLPAASLARALAPSPGIILACREHGKWFAIPVGLSPCVRHGDRASVLHVLTSPRSGTSFARPYHFFWGFSCGSCR